MAKSEPLTSTPAWKRILAYALRGLTYLGAMFICFEISVWIHPPMLAWGLTRSKLLASEIASTRRFNTPCDAS